MTFCSIILISFTSIAVVLYVLVLAGLMHTARRADLLIEKFMEELMLKVDRHDQ